MTVDHLIALLQLAVISGHGDCEVKHEYPEVSIQGIDVQSEEGVVYLTDEEGYSETYS